MEEKDGFRPAKPAVTRIMPEVPKIVRERLRSGVLASRAGEPTSQVLGPHPDADLLAAFAEQALLPAERERVLAHLAICEDCRTAILVALPPMEDVAVTREAANAEAAALSGASRRMWFSRPMFAWPTLRWGALAAGLVVAGALLLHHSGNSNPATVARQAVPDAKAKLAGTPAAETSQKFEAAASDTIPAERDKLLADQKTAEVARKLDSDLAAQNRPVARAKDAETKSVVVANKQLTALATPAAKDVVNGLMGGKQAAAPSPPRETVEVSGATSALQSAEPIPLSTRNENSLMAKNEGAPPVKKAKPATAAEQSAPMQMARAAAPSSAAERRFDSAQAPQVLGIVTDPSGAAVANAKVTVTNRGTGQSISTTTDQSGVYSLKELPLGTYQLMAEASGFKSVSDSDVTLAPGVTAHNFKLPVGQTSEMVAVMGANAAVQTESLKGYGGVPSAKWSLSAGMLRRSLDGGTTWQTSLPEGHLLCHTARGNEIWAGGKSGLLFHSTDNGATWTQVHPSIGNRSLNDDVSHLEFRSATAISLSTSNGKTWISSDDGKSWTNP